MIQAKHQRFLIDYLHTDKIRHSGRDFFTHLKGTHDLLNAWGNPPEICWAGLFHSIYGTQRFRRKAFPIEKRSIIRSLIGERAEFLAYVFCVTQRPKVFLDLINVTEAKVADLHVQTAIVLSPADLSALLEIEAANLIEQGGNVRRALEKLQDARISAAARSCIQSVLSRDPSHALAIA